MLSFWKSLNIKQENKEQAICLQIQWKLWFYLSQWECLELCKQIDILKLFEFYENLRFCDKFMNIIILIKQETCHF